MSDEYQFEELDGEDQKLYIKSLESSIKILQNENNQLKSISERNLNKDIQEEITYEDYTHIAETDNQGQLIKILTDILDKKFKFLENSLFYYNASDGLKPIRFIETMQQFYDKCNTYIENGIVDFVIENDEIRLIPDLDTSIEDENHKLLFIPTKIKDQKNLVLIAKLTDEISRSPLVRLREILTIVSLKLNQDSTISTAKTNQSYGNQIVELIGEKLKLDLEKIEAQIDLLSSGIGNPKARIKLLKNDFTDLQKLSEITSTFNSSEKDIFNLISNVKFFSESHLNKLAIEINFEVSDNIQIVNYFDNLQNILIKLVFILSENSPEGSEINIISFIEQNTLYLKLQDNGYGFSQQFVENLNFDRQFEKEDNNFEALSSLKSDLNINNISFEMVSKERAGTSINLSVAI